MLRFAISPTADIDINGLRIAILNFILAKQKNEELLIRIDDTNKEKNIEGKDKEILEILNLFNIEHSRVVLQSENIKYHVGMGMNLLLDKKAFNCFCSDEALASDRQKAKKEGKDYSYSGFCETISDETKFQCNAPFVVRLKKPKEDIKFIDLLKGSFDFTPDGVDAEIILNHDKTPTYNFACAVDDMLYDISTIVRSDKHIENTPKQIHIMNSLGYDKKIEYVHISKLVSDFDEEMSIKWFIDEGFLPSAIANYLVLLSSDTTKEIFTLEEAIKWFDIKKISTNEVVFDIEKLKLINKEHLKSIDNMRLSKLLGFADEDIGSLGKVYLEDLCTIKEIKSKMESIFSKKETCEGFDLEYKKIKEILEALPFIDDYAELEREVKVKSGFEGEKFTTPFRFALTGETAGPSLDKIYPCIKNYLGEII